MADYNRMHTAGINTMPDTGDLPSIEEALGNLDALDGGDIQQPGSPPPPSNGVVPPPSEGASATPESSESPESSQSPQDQEAPKDGKKPILEEFTSGQTFGLVAIVWVLLAISIILAVLFNVIGGKKESTLNGGASKGGDTVDIGSMELDKVQVEDASWTDTMVISKQIIWEDSSVIPVFVGTPTNWEKQITIPVDMTKYNMIADGATIQITFKRLGVNNEEKLIVLKWTEMK